MEPIPTGASAALKKQYYSTSSPFEAQVGYYRAVRHGQHILVSGTTAVDPESSPTAPQILFPGDARQQTRVALMESINAVKALGGTAASIVRTRMYVSRHEDCPAVLAGFRETLGRYEAGIGTTATMVAVNGFVDKEMLVEVEMDAIVDE